MRQVLDGERIPFYGTKEPSDEISDYVTSAEGCKSWSRQLTAAKALALFR